MKTVKSIIVAFSLYSQIPMPQFEWKEEDMKHNIVFLPWIGAVIGLLAWGMNRLLQMVSLPLICEVSLYALIPLIVTGGFHVDGYLDVQDALKSYKSKEEKLKILSDPHIGAFAVIRLLILSLIVGCALSVICDKNNEMFWRSFFVIFFYARALAAVYSIKLTHARKDGMLHMETGKSGNADLVVCVFQALIGIALFIIISPYTAIALVCASVVHFLYFRHLCYKQFGGVTGDTIGYGLTTLEAWLVVVIAILSLLM